MEKRILKILFSKSGNGYPSPKINLPTKWIKDMGVSEENRDVSITYDEEKKEIIIRKEN